MVTQIKAWECDVCGERYFDEAEVKEHEKIKPSNPLPVGFVYLDNYHTGSYVGGQEYGIILPGKLEFNMWHKPIQEAIEFCALNVESRWELKPIGTRCLNQDYTGSPFDTKRGYDEYCHSLNKEKFRRFCRIYSLKRNQEIRKKLGLQASDLTNKL